MGFGMGAGASCTGVDSGCAGTGAGGREAASRGAAFDDSGYLRLHRFELDTQPLGDRVELRVGFVELHAEGLIGAVYFRGELVDAPVQQPDLVPRTAKPAMITTATAMTTKRRRPTAVSSCPS